MARQALNEAFAQTSFLHGTNAAYIEEMQAAYERNPGSVSDEWRLFFQNLQDVGDAGRQATEGPSWAPPLDVIQQSGDADLVGALTGDYAGVERHISNRLQERAQANGFELSMAASLRSTQDSIRALMLIRDRKSVV